MDEKRNVKRWHTLQYLKVFNQQSEKPVGRLVNISTEGMMLMCEKPVKTDTAYRLRLVLSEESGNKKPITVEAISRWCEKSVNPDFFDAGFQLKNVSRENADDIEQLIQDSTFDR